MERYDIVQHVGRGSFGYVVKAFDNRDRRNVALKIFTKGKEYDKSAKNEIRVCKHLQDRFGTTPRNVAAYYDSFKSEGRWCIVFELLGSNLKEIMNQTQIGLVPKKLRFIAKSVLAGLDFLHESGLIHTDLKPDNIVVKRKDTLECKIIDLGLGLFVSEIDDVQEFSPPLQHRLYRAPEVFLKGPITEKIDVFSVGCILAELCMRRPIFNGPQNVTQMATMVEYLGLPPRDLLEVSLNAHTFFYIFRSFIAFKRTDGLRRVEPRSRRLRDFFKNNNEDPNFIDFMEKCLDINPFTRYTAEELLEHAWVKTGDTRRPSPVLCAVM